MTDTARLHPDVAAFAASVRARLSDLDADEIEELTGELEADLQERFDETGSDFGDPGSYAAELRAAAGLPRREPRTDRHWYAAAVASLARSRAALAERLRTNPAAAAVLDLLIVFRPVWWLARAWVAYQVVHALVRTNAYGQWLPDSVLGWTALLAAVAVSVQLGRTGAYGLPWLRVVVVVGGVVAVLSAPFAYIHADGLPYMRSTSIAASVGGSHRGLSMNGHAVRNVFAYDAQGNPLSDVQLYDEDGKPLAIGKRQSWRWISVPATLRTGQQAWNVFPLDRVRWGQSKYDRTSNQRVPETGVTPEKAPLPLAHAPAIFSAPAEEGDDTADGTDNQDTDNSDADRSEPDAR